MLENKHKNNNLEREQKQISWIVKESGGKLTGQLVNNQCELERRKPDGTKMLGLLHPVGPIVGGPGYCPVRLERTTRRLQCSEYSPRVQRR